MSQNWFVVPCFNESARVQPDEFLRFCAAQPETSFLFVDDASTDTTGEVLGAMAARAGGRIEVITLPANVGKAEAVRAGFTSILPRGPELVGYIDADLATPLSEVQRLLAACGDPEVAGVLGSRIAMLGCDIERTAARHYLGRVFATLASSVLKLPVYDTQCGAKVFRTSPALCEAMATPFRSRWVFDVEILQRILRADPDARLVELPLRRWADVSGSALSPRAMAGALRDLFALRS